MPIAFLLTGGQASDSPQFPILLDIGPDVYPRAALADKGYDSHANRQAARARGVVPAIPYRSNVKDQPKFFLITRQRQPASEDGKALERFAAR